MIDKEYSLTLDLKDKFKNKLPPSPIEFVREDFNSSVLNISLTNNGQIIDLTGCTIQANFKKQDNTIVVIDTIGDYVTITDAINGVIRCELTTQILAVVGYVFSNVSIINPDFSKVTSTAFKFRIRENFDSSEVIESINDYPVLIQLISQNNEAIQKDVVRQSNESTRQSQESTRSGNETSRVNAESIRGSNEAVRQSNEASRNTAETTRASNETQRITNETTRGNNETTRQANETARVSSEAARVLADNLRQSEWTTYQNQNTMLNDLNIRKAILIPVRTALTVTRAALAFNPLYSYNPTSLTTVANDTIVDNGMTKDNLCYHGRNQVRGGDSIIFKTINEHILNGAEVI